MLMSQMTMDMVYLLQTRSGPSFIAYEILSDFFNMSNMTDVTSGSGTGYPSGSQVLSDFMLINLWFSVLYFMDHCFSCLSFLYCLYFHLPLCVTLSSNCSQPSGLQFSLSPYILLFAFGLWSHHHKILYTNIIQFIGFETTFLLHILFFLRFCQKLQSYPLNENITRNETWQTIHLNTRYNVK